MTTAAPIHVEVNRNVRSVLAQWDMDQADLAAWLDITPTSVSRLMKNQRPWSLDYLQKLAEILGVSVSELTGPTAKLIARLPDTRPVPSPRTRADVQARVTTRFTHSDIQSGETSSFRHTIRLAA